MGESEHSAGGRERFGLLHHIIEHPIPGDQERINEMWDPSPEGEEPPTPNEARESYMETIAEWDEWHVFRPYYPFGDRQIVIWNRSFGEGYIINDEEGRWHNLVNLFAEIVEEENDCRDTDYSSSLMPSGSYKQRCETCNQTWSVE